MGNNENVYISMLQTSYFSQYLLVGTTCAYMSDICDEPIPQSHATLILLSDDLLFRLRIFCFSLVLEPINTDERKRVVYASYL